MPIINVRDNKNNRWKGKAKKEKRQKDRKTQRSGASYSESVRAKWFCCAFKLGFVQLICKASLIFKSDLDLALSINLKERKLYESKHVTVECRCLKMCNFLSFLTCSSVLVLKLQQLLPI